MNILIINTNQNRQPFSVMPVGACMVADAASRTGHRVSLLDLMFEKSPIDALTAELQRSKPEVVGLSVRNIDNNDLRNPVVYFEALPSLVETVRQQTQATVVLGGSAVGLMPEALLRYAQADWAVIGNGELVFPQFLDALEQNRRPDHLAGVGWIENGVFYQNPPTKDEMPDSCLVPDYSRWLAMKRYQSCLSTIPMQTKRGCPYDCVYCTYAISEGRDYRLGHPDHVVREAANLVDQGFSDIEFVDNVFNSPYEHAMAICSGLAKLRRRPRLQSVELNPMYVDRALLTSMERAGFVGFGITAESVSNTVLSGLRKGYKTQHVIHAAECVRNHKIPCAWIFVLGGPGETMSTMQETLYFARHYVRPGDVAFFNIGLRIYPGTQIERIARNEGVLTLSAREMLEPVFYLSPQINREALIHKLHTAVSSNMNFLDSTSLALPLVPQIYRLGYRLGIRHPIWKHTRIIRTVLRMVGMKV